MSARPILRDAGWCFEADGAHDLAVALDRLLDSLGARTMLLGLGEPTHGQEEFPLLRNQVFRQLVEHQGFRAIAVESHCLAALTVDAFVTQGRGSLDEVMHTGFSHGFGSSDANRRLVAWMREYNRDRSPAQQLRFYGFDAPTEISGADSPRQALIGLYEYLAASRCAARLPCTPETIDQLLGADERWSNPAAAVDPSQSIGASREARQLRLIADDLVGALTAQSPGLIAATSHDDWWRACLYGRTAAGLLRYHAAMADSSDSRATYLAHLLTQRDAMMAANLLAVVAREARRGPSLVFAHNSHLQKTRSTMHLPAGWGAVEDYTVAWWSAGAIAAAQLGDHYAFLASAVGSAADLGLGAPEPDTLEGALYPVAEGRGIFPSQRLAEAFHRSGTKPTPRTDAETMHHYSALGPDHLDGSDGIVFIKDIPSRAH